MQFSKRLDLFGDEIFSALIIAHVFGVISPNNKMMMVKIPLAIPTATFPETSMANVVTREDAKIFTILLPIKMVLSIFP